MTLACIRASLILVSSRTTSTESLATEERKGLSQPSSSDCCSCPLMIKAFSKSLAAASTCPSPGVCEQGDGKRAVRYRGHRRSGEQWRRRRLPATGKPHGGSRATHGHRIHALRAHRWHLAYTESNGWSDLRRMSSKPKRIAHHINAHL